MSKKRKKYTLRIPLSAKGGIRSQNHPGSAARIWWQRRWIECLERLRLGARLGRGRSYAVAGQVLELEVAPGQVEARVQGAGETPYNCSISCRQLEEAQRAELLEELCRRPILLGRLLVNNLPLEVEQLFLALECPLFPQGRTDFITRCDCPDYANPCKHLAAIYYLLGEAITQNPLLLLLLRGLQLFDTQSVPPGTQAKSVAAGASAPPPETAAERAALEPAAFYGETLRNQIEFGSSELCTEAAALVRRLGAPPFWRSHERFGETFTHLYGRIAQRGLNLWAGDPLDLRSAAEKVVVKGANLKMKQRRIRIDDSW